MSKTGVFIIDDSSVIRMMLSRVISDDPDLEVVGTASNGKIALKKLETVNPDIITLDVEMPEMDGLETLVEIRKKWRTIPVIMFSTLTERGASITIDALANGASDYATKPSQTSRDGAIEHVRNDLVYKIKSLRSSKRLAEIRRRSTNAPARVSPPVTKPTSAQPAPLTKSSQKTRQPTPPVAQRPRNEQVLAGTTPKATPSQRSAIATKRSRIDVMAVGTSTGGPNALHEFLVEFPATFPIPIVIVQHMPAMFTKLLAERLNQNAALEVHEAKHGDEIRAGGVWIAPGGYHMVIKRSGTHILVETNEEPPENSCRPAVDVLFRSVNQVYGARTLAVVLTGMGQDGLLGCEQVHQSGGHIIIQDEDSSVVWGMPGAVAKANYAHEELPLNEIPGRVCGMVGMRR